MHSSNGIDLTDTEFEILKQFVSLHDDQAVMEFARQDIKTNPKKIDSYIRLCKFDLINCKNPDIWSDTNVKGTTQLGVDFVEDVKKLERRERIRTYLPSIIVAVLGIGGTLGGVLLGWFLRSL